MVHMISDEVRQLRTHAQAKNIALIFDPPAKPLPDVEIDENKTRQVIMNFIDNAIYYTQAGEVRIVLEQFGDHVRMEVRDTGIGVPKDARKKLFSKFFRAGNAQIVRPDGTGLGLYLAKRVVEDQGGTIIFDSVEGKGSTFGFELPFRAEPAKQEVTHGRHARSKH
jgi:signal transduction histidine kinase